MTQIITALLNKLFFFLYSDTICDLGGVNELANYGEYSGAPSEQQTYDYAKTILSLMTREKHPEGKSCCGFKAVGCMWGKNLNKSSYCYAETSPAGLLLYRCLASETGMDFCQLSLQREEQVWLEIFLLDTVVLSSRLC